MKKIILIFVLALVAIAGCTPNTDLKQICCIQCRNSVDAMFSEQPQIDMQPESVKCTYFKGGKLQLTGQCTEYFDENPMIVSECR